EEQLRAILKDLEEEEPPVRGKELIPLDLAAKTLVLVRPRDWVDEALVRGLGDKVWSHFPDPLVALGVLGERAAPVRKRLFEAHPENVRRVSGQWLCTALALARVEPKKRDAELRRFCKNVDKIGDCKGIWLLDASWSNALVLVEADAVKSLVKLVGD